MLWLLPPVTFHWEAVWKLQGEEAVDTRLTPLRAVNLQRIREIKTIVIATGFMRVGACALMTQTLGRSVHLQVAPYMNHLHLRRYAVARMINQLEHPLSKTKQNETNPNHFPPNVHVCVFKASPVLKAHVTIRRLWRGEIFHFELFCLWIPTVEGRQDCVSRRGYSRFTLSPTDVPYYKYWRLLVPFPEVTSQTCALIDSLEIKGNNVWRGTKL